MAVTCLGAVAQPTGMWTVARSEHFEVYSQAGEASARAALRWFEQLRGLLAQQTGLKLDGLQPVRVIGFRSSKEYEPFRLRPAAAAYSIGTGRGNSGLTGPAIYYVTRVQTTSQHGEIKAKARPSGKSLRAAVIVPLDGKPACFSVFSAAILIHDLLSPEEMAGRVGFL
jgi:hypothetical protein